MHSSRDGLGARWPAWQPTIGGEPRDGFALMRDPERGLLAFHAVPPEPFDLTASRPPAAEQFVIHEEAFEPAPEEPVTEIERSRS